MSVMRSQPDKSSVARELSDKRDRSDRSVISLLIYRQFKKVMLRKRNICRRWATLFGAGSKTWTHLTSFVSSHQFLLTLLHVAHSLHSGIKAIIIDRTSRGRLKRSCRACPSVRNKSLERRKMVSLFDWACTLPFSTSCYKQLKSEKHHVLCSNLIAALHFVIEQELELALGFFELMCKSRCLLWTNVLLFYFDLRSFFFLESRLCRKNKRFCWTSR